MKLKMTEDEIKRVLADVQKAVGKPLAKAEGDADMAPPAADDKMAAPPAPPAAGPALDAAQDGQPHDEAAEIDDMGAGAGDQDGPLDPEQLCQEYAGLPAEDLKMHYLAAKKALEMQMGADQSGAATDASAMAPPAAGPAPEKTEKHWEGLAQSEKAEGMSKSEQDGPAKGDKLSPDGKANGPALADKAASGAKADGPALADKIAKEEKSKEETSKEETSKEESKMLSKAEFEGALESMKSENATLKEQIGKLAKTFTDYLETPVRKAVTGVTNEEDKSAKAPNYINPSIVSERLKGKIGSFSKADRDLVSDFYDGKVSLSKLAHLLK